MFDINPDRAQKGASMVKKVIVNGQEVEARLVDHTTVAENWSEYALGNGKTLRFKFVITRVLETDVMNPAGERVYSLDGQPVFVVNE